jgi:hypothetical protein
MNRHQPPERKKTAKPKGYTLSLMDSRRTYRSSLLLPLASTLSGKAAFSLENLVVFLKQYSDAGFIAGVFFGYGCRSVA